MDKKVKARKKTPKGFHTRVETNKKRELKKNGEPIHKYRDYHQK